MPIRTVRDFREVNDALREVFDFMDYMKSKNIDLNGRQIKNAGLSKDNRDYVCRQELLDLVGGGEQAPRKQKPASPSTYDKVTFGIGVKKDVDTGEDLTPPYIWTNALNGKRPNYIAMACNIVPGGSDLVIDILLKRPNSIWAAGVSIFSGEGTPTNQYGYPFIPSTDNGGLPKVAYIYDDTILKPPSIFGGFQREDIISISCLQKGSIIPGQDIETVLFCPLA